MIESVTTTGVNGTAWWQASQRRLRKRLMSKGGTDREAHVVTYQSVRKILNPNHPFQSYVFHTIPLMPTFSHLTKMNTRASTNHFHSVHSCSSVVHESIQQSKNDFRTQPKVLEYLHETSEALFMPLIEAANGEAGTGFVIHKHTAQQVFEESSGSDSNQSSLQDFLGQPPSRQFSDDENDHCDGGDVEQEVEEQADHQEGTYMRLKY